MILTADFKVHLPFPSSERDWTDIAAALETAGVSVGLDLLGVSDFGRDAEGVNDGPDE